MIGKDGVIENDCRIPKECGCRNNDIDHSVNETKEVVLAWIGNSRLFLCRLGGFFGAPGFCR